MVIVSTAREQKSKHTSVYISAHRNTAESVEEPSTRVACAYLQSKLVEEVVDEVLDKADDAEVQVLPRDAVEDDASGGRRQLVAEPVVLLVAVDSDLEGQDGQHQQVVLMTHTRSSP